MVKNRLYSIRSNLTVILSKRINSMLKKPYSIKGNKKYFIVKEGGAKKLQIKLKKVLSEQTNCNKFLNFYSLNIFTYKRINEVKVRFRSRKAFEDYLKEVEGFDDYWVGKLSMDNGYLERGDKVYLAFCNE